MQERKNLHMPLGQRLGAEMIRAYILLASLMAMFLLPLASASGTLAGAEICSDGACSGWMLGYSDDDNHYSIYNGPTSNTSCDNNTFNFGFAIAGENNMCSSRTDCDSCHVELTMITL